MAAVSPSPVERTGGQYRAESCPARPWARVGHDFLSGIILHVEHTIKPGDVIVVKDRWVQVEKIGVRNTVGKTHKGEEVLIPNSTVAQSVVTNLTRGDEVS